MEKVETKVIKTEEVEHSFYCDACNTYLGTSKEDDDGHYKHIGEFVQSVQTSGVWFRLKRTYCKTCALNYARNNQYKIAETLIDLGFEQDESHK